MIEIARPLTLEHRIDWRRVLENLQRAGLTLPQIAEWLEVGKATLYGYLNEDTPSEPSYWIGHCLLVLWCSRCGARLEDVPLRAVPLSISRMLSTMT